MSGEGLVKARFEDVRKKLKDDYEKLVKIVEQKIEIIYKKTADKFAKG